MPVYRVTTFFGQANMGWSETWWTTQSTLNNALKVSSNLIGFRNDLLTQQHSILAVRVATEGSKAQSQLLLPGNQTLGNGGETINVPANGDYPEGSSSLQYDQVRANLHCIYLLGGRRLSLRYMVGIPDVSSKTESATLDGINPAQWWLKWRQYHNYLMNAGWQIKCLERGSGNPERKIRRWVTRGTPPDVAGVQLAPGTTVAVEVGDEVQIKGVKMSSDGIRTPNRKWVVEDLIAGTSENGPTIYLRGSEGIDPSTIRILGTFRPVKYEYLTFDDYRALRVGVHKRGKAFGSPVGRAKTKRFAA